MTSLADYASSTRTEEEKAELQYISDSLSYDHTSGTVRWKIDIPHLGITPGRVAGHRDTRYWRIKVKGKKYPLHVVAWYLHTGNWCMGRLDHIDRDGFNNKIDNLRLVTASQNQYNRTQPMTTSAPVAGIRYKYYKWEVQVGKLYVGRADTLLDAVAMRINKLTQLGVAV